MPQFGTIKAWIEVDGIPLEEFRIEVDEDKRTVQCYVASETGKNFAVWKCWEGDCVASSKLTIDGRKGSLRQSLPGARRARMSTITLPGEPTLRAKLMFGDMQTTEDEASSLQDENLIKALGSIELEVQTGNQTPKLVKPVPDPLQTAASTTSLHAPDQQPVYERMKKAGCHRVVFGELVPAPTPVAYTFHKDDTEPVRFVFFYRSRDILIAQGIMPPPERAATPPENEGTAHSHANDTSIKEEEAQDAVDEEENDERLRAIEGQAAAISAQAAAMTEQAAAFARQSEAQAAAMTEQAAAFTRQAEAQATAIAEQAAAFTAQAQAIKERMEKRKLERRDGPARKRVKVEEIDAKKAFRLGEVVDLCDD